MAVARKAVEKGRSTRGRKRRKLVYFFGGGKAEGKAGMRDLLGGKGANLAEMANLGLPVPPGFTISTEVCTYFYRNGRKYPPGLKAEVSSNLGRVEKLMGRRFGDKEAPLLVSVRSGARASMPGMMDTVLNIGLNDDTVTGLAKASGNERFAWDSYRRLVHMYGDVVLGLKPDKKEDDPFEQLLEARKKRCGVAQDTDLSAGDLRDLVEEFKNLIRQRLGVDFPMDPEEQLWGAIGAVFGSWENPRAIAYRKLYGIPSDWGTAVNVQAMVFGNLGEDCATGVAFTRDPASGEKVFYGEFLRNAQGEDVVAGIRTPQALSLAASRQWAKRTGVEEAERRKKYASLEELMPPCFKELERIARKLERHYRDMQDLEFTIEHGRLWMLQTRNGKRTAAAAVKIAVDMTRERLIDRATAVMRINPADLDQLLHPTLDPKAPKRLLAKGLPASPGAAAGKIVLSAEDAERAAREGERVVLVRVETSPEDINGMNVAEGILTARGGMTSHAAVVARGMGKCCVAGCGELEVDYERDLLRIGGIELRPGDWITLDGGTGEVFAGEVPTLEPQLGGDFSIIMKWADQIRRLRVRTNADTPHDARVARQFGAEGIGLCRTEHMFFEGDRIDAVRAMILAEDAEDRRRAIERILPMQRGDFIGIFREMAGLPVNIRLLDPPLHEFLPNSPDEIRELAAKLGIEVEKLRSKCDALREFNPMLGHRGCRLGITFPEIYQMQVRAIMEAAVELTKQNVKVLPEIMIPLVGHVEELRLLRQQAAAVCEEVLSAAGVKVRYAIGTMIEVPRAAVTADEIAREAEFFSFGTNDLTQMAFGLSRDDSGKFLPQYVKLGILPSDPFVTLDQSGVGLLVRQAVGLGRRTRKDLKIGICGEHGGDPSSIAFCHRVGLDYVSCSPYRVPIARLAAAQAALADSGKRKGH